MGSCNCKHHIKLVACLLCIGSASAQPAIYRNLVLEGGGIRGVAYVGAMDLLDSLQVLEKIERVGGSSAGAIQATLLALGYSPAEMQQIVRQTPIRSFNDGSSVFFWKGFRRLRRNYGWYKGDAVDKWIAGLIARKTGDPDLRFGQLHAMTRDSGYKDLYITGTDLTSQCRRIFSFEKYPAMRIRDAVRISMSIPVYYQAVFMDADGKIYKERPDSISLFVMADGGLTGNFPIYLFDSTRYCEQGTNMEGNQYRWNDETLGLLLENPDQLNFTRSGLNVYAAPVNSLKSYLGSIYRLLIDKANPDTVPPNQASRTIAINNLGIFPRVKRLPKATTDQLIESGREGVRAFFGIENK